MRFRGTYSDINNLPQDAINEDWCYVQEGMYKLDTYQYIDDQWNQTQTMDYYAAHICACTELENYIRKTEDGYPHYERSVMFWKIIVQALAKSKDSFIV